MENVSVRSKVIHFIVERGEEWPSWKASLEFEFEDGRASQVCFFSLDIFREDVLCTEGSPDSSF